MKLAHLLSSILVATVIVGCSSIDNGDGLRVVPKGASSGGTSMSKEEVASKQGIPLYPGADSPQDKRSVLAGVTESRYTMVLTTSDPVKKVVAFYKSKLPELNGGNNGGGAEFRGRTADKSPVHLQVSSKDGKTNIMLEVIVSSPAPSATP